MGDSPSAAAASVWPRLTDVMPARTISAMNEAVYITRPTSSASSPAGAVNPPTISRNRPSGCGVVITRGDSPVATTTASQAAPAAIRAVAAPASRGYDGFPLSVSRRVSAR